MELTNQIAVQAEGILAENTLLLSDVEETVASQVETTNWDDPDEEEEEQNAEEGTSENTDED